jgi:hypothetical protein
MNRLKVLYSGVFVLGLALILLTSPVSAQVDVADNNTTTAGNESAVGICIIGVDSPCNGENYETPTPPTYEGSDPKTLPPEHPEDPDYRDSLPRLPVDNGECVPGPATMCDHHLTNQSNENDSSLATVEPISAKADTGNSVVTSVTEFFKSLFSKIL